MVLMWLSFRDGNGRIEMDIRSLKCFQNNHGVFLVVIQLLAPNAFKHIS